MISIKDRSDLLPELLTVDNYTIVHHDPDVEICATFGDIDASDVFTLFVNREPDIHTAHVDFRYLTELRPNYLFLTAAWSDSQQWKLQNINFCSNVLITARANQQVDAVSVDKKTYNGLCLFGGSSSIRNSMFARMQQSSLLDSCLVNIQPRPGHDEEYISFQSPDIKKYDNSEFADVAYTKGTFFSMIPMGDNIWLSQIIAQQLYNQCYIDIVTETAGLYPDLFYISEKLSKTLVVGMPFLVFGCRHFLQHLKKLGFRTYSQWLDESYDDIEDSTVRALAIVDALKQFSSLPENKKIQFLHESQDISEHNRRLALDYSHWIKPVVQAIDSRFAQQ